METTTTVINNVTTAAAPALETNSTLSGWQKLLMEHHLDITTGQPLTNVDELIDPDYSIDYEYGYDC